MKNSTGILTIIILSTAFVLSGCDTDRSSQMESAETSVIEAERDLEISKAEVQAEYRVYKLENENRLQRHERTIERIKEDINNESDRDERARLETKLNEKEAKHAELKREIDNYSPTGRENWDNFRDSFSDRMDDLGDSLDDFFSTSSGTATTSRN